MELRPNENILSGKEGDDYIFTGEIIDHVICLKMYIADWVIKSHRGMFDSDPRYEDGVMTWFLFPTDITALYEFLSAHPELIGEPK